MNNRKIDLKFEPVPVVYEEIQNAELAILSISSCSWRLNLLLKEKLLDKKFVVSKFQKNISRFFKNHFDKNETSFLVVNVMNVSDFKNKLIELAYQFAGTSLVVKCKNERLYFDVENRANILRSVRKRDFFQELQRWNKDAFEFEDEIFLYPN